MNTFAVFLRVTCLAVCCNMIAAIQGGMLYPRESESRQIQELNGMWNFRADRSPTRNVGLTEKWFQHKLSQVPPRFSSLKQSELQRNINSICSKLLHFVCQRKMLVTPLSNHVMDQEASSINLCVLAHSTWGQY